MAGHTGMLYIICNMAMIEATAIPHKPVFVCMGFLRMALISMEII